METTVSVIIPTYNRAALLPRSIRSVLNQTFEDFELIIVDDGSTDNTEKVVKNFDDQRIVYIKNHKNTGATAARNEGIRRAKAKFIAFQDSDDEWLPQKLDLQMNIMEQSELNVGIVFTGFYRIQNGREEYIPKKHVLIKEGDIHGQLLKENFITTQSILIRKECFNKVGLFDENLPRLQDWDLVLRVSKYYYFKFINEPLLIAYHTEDSITSDNELYGNAIEMILSKYSEEFDKNKKILSKHLFSAGINMAQIKNFNKAKSLILRSIKERPFNAKYLFVYFISLLGQKTFILFVNHSKKLKT